MADMQRQQLPRRVGPEAPGLLAVAHGARQRSIFGCGAGAAAPSQQQQAQQPDQARKAARAAEQPRGQQGLGGHPGGTEAAQGASPANDTAAIQGRMCRAGGAFGVACTCMQVLQAALGPTGQW